MLQFRIDQEEVVIRVDSSAEILQAFASFSDLLSTQLGAFLAHVSPSIRLAEARAVTSLDMKGRILTWEVAFDEVNLLFDHVEFVAHNTKIQVNLDVVNRAFRSNVITLGDVSSETTAKLQVKGKTVDKELSKISQMLKSQIDTALLR